MKISEVNLTPNITVVDSGDSENSTKPVQPAETINTSLEDSSQKIYRIGSEIVPEAVFKQYDTNGDGIISESEKAAYLKAANKSTGNTIDLTA